MKTRIDWWRVTVFVSRWLSWPIVLMVLFPSIGRLEDKSIIAYGIFVLAVWIVGYHVYQILNGQTETQLKKHYENRVIVDGFSKSIAAFLQNQLEVQREDCVQEYLAAYRLEWEAKNYIKENYPPKCSGLESWPGYSNIDVSWISKEFPNNFDFRDKVARLRRSAKLWEDSVAFCKRDEDDRKKEEKQKTPERFCSKADCVYEVRKDGLCMFHGVGGYLTGK